MRPPTAAPRDRGALPRRAAAFTAAMLLSIGLVQLVPAAGPAAAQDLGTRDVQINSTTSESGFSHPGVGLTEPILENVRTQLAAGAEPWTSGFEALQRSGAAAENDLNTGVSSYYTVDFGEGVSVRLDGLYFLPRLCCTSRSDGTIVQGSNDGQTWTDLSEPHHGRCLAGADRLRRCLLPLPAARRVLRPLGRR